jgi:hypothetical protein
VVTICTASLTFNNCTLCPHNVLMCFVFIWEQTATCATYSINWLVVITQMKSVYSAVRTLYLNKTVCHSSLNGLMCTFLNSGDMTKLWDCSWRQCIKRASQVLVTHVCGLIRCLLLQVMRRVRLTSVNGEAAIECREQWHWDTSGK